MTLNINSFKDKNIVCIGFSPWKREALSLFLERKNLRFIKHFHNNLNPNTDHLIIWASNKTIPLEQSLINSGFNYHYCEDGFMRSSGLGIKLFIPGSLSFSKNGIHFDSTKETELENLLNNVTLTSQEKDRAHTIIEFIKQRNISKYGNLGQEPFPKIENNNKNILIIGQVENDASLEFGSPNIKRNKDFIENVINNTEKSNLFYKPHPDVVAKLRPGEVSKSYLQENNVVEIQNTPLSECINSCDEVHVLSSQSGLDALILNKKVICYGVPFYSGWGLTTDKNTTERREKKLSLEELIYVSFVKYPTYVNPKTKKKCEIEEILELISNKDFKWPHAPFWMQSLVKIKREYLKVKNEFIN